MKCLNCSKEFEAKRKTAKFCSDKCRVYASRHTLVTLGTVGESVKVIKEEPLPFKGFCKHGADPSFCRFAKNGKSCK